MYFRTLLGCIGPLILNLAISYEFTVFSPCQVMYLYMRGQALKMKLILDTCVLCTRNERKNKMQNY